MQALKVVIEHLADCLDSAIQVNHYLAELYNQCYVAKKKIGPDGDPRCFNWALFHRDRQLLITALPDRENNALTILKDSLLRKGDHQLFTWIGSKLPGFHGSCLINVIQRNDFATFNVMLDQVKNCWNDASIFLCEAAELAAARNKAEFFPTIRKASAERSQWFPTIPQDMIEYENGRVESAFVKGAARGGHPLPKLEE